MAYVLSLLSNGQYNMVFCTVTFSWLWSSTYYKSTEDKYKKIRVCAVPHFSIFSFSFAVEEKKEEKKEESEESDDDMGFGLFD